MHGKAPPTRILTNEGFGGWRVCVVGTDSKQRRGRSSGGKESSTRRNTGRPGPVPCPNGSCSVTQALVRPLQFQIGRKYDVRRAPHPNAMATASPPPKYPPAPLSQQQNTPHATALRHYGTATQWSAHKSVNEVCRPPALACSRSRPGPSPSPAWSCPPPVQTTA